MAPHTSPDAAASPPPPWPEDLLADVAPQCAAIPPSTALPSISAAELQMGAALGAGTFGMVHSAMWAAAGGEVRRVAVKRLTLSGAASDASAFEREVRLGGGRTPHPVAG